ncbi:SBBP repeat-containing protein [Deinococcus apachensis]|uniref:SBBP repeat-containing protein n=1 Tax=Deinococcus apachensis TaxID=309886 RepID=UPI0003807299|nr:SBBP repeat-containing protein [Deinococcus apachensis]
MTKNNRLLLLLAGLLSACGQPAAPQVNQRPAPDVKAPTALTPQSGTRSGDQGSAVARYSSGVYMAGSTRGALYDSNQGDEDAFLAKYDAAGNLVWGRQFGSSGQELVYQIATDRYDNVYMVGRTEGGLKGNNQGGYDGFIRKYTPSGAVAWTRQIGTTGSDGVGGVAVEPNGNLFWVSQAINGKAAVSAYTRDGTRLWTRFSALCSGTVATNEYGALYTASFTYSAGGGTDRCIRKLQPGTGGVMWERRSHSADTFYGTSLAVSYNDVYLAGIHQINPYNAKLSLARYDGVTGAERWRYDSLGSSADYLGSVGGISATAEGIYLTGYHRDTSTSASTIGAFITRFGADGSWTWFKTIAADPSPTNYGTFGFGVATRVVKGGVNGQSALMPDPFPSTFDVTQVYTTGYTYADLGAGHQGDKDAFLRRLDGATGNTVWTK